jgi:glycosyltransferase involved in cell wall biosynthesis
MGKPADEQDRERFSAMSPPYRLAILGTHPIQYHTPWFRGLAEHPDLRIHVYYCHKATPEEQARAGFGVAFEWDVPLLEGYPYSFLQNVANPAGQGRFAGFDTPEIGKIIRERQFDAVLVNGWNYKSAWQAFRAAWSVDVKVLVRGDSHLHTPRSLLVKMAKSLAYPRFISRFDACLAAGQWSREYFAYYGAHPDRIFLVPHTVEITCPGDKLLLRSEVRQRFSLRENAVVFLFAGKFIPKKRPLDFLYALQRASVQDARVQGLMAGDGPLRADCEEFVRSTGASVAFAGFLNQSRIVDAYLAADVVVLPSDGETWGLVVNEAMTCGCPCIVSDQVGCGPDLVIPNVTGIVFPQGDVPALSAAMNKLAQNPSQIDVMGANARDRLRHYSVSAAVEGVLESLEATSIATEPVCTR